MIGTTVHGYVVTSVLGSGRTGILYEAQHPATGRKAIVRLCAAEPDEGLVEVFTEEATLLLSGEGPPRLQRARTPDGREVMLLERVAPGTGRTRYARTERLSTTRPDRPALQEKPPLKRLLLAAAVALVLLGAASAVAVLALPGGEHTPSTAGAPHGQQAPAAPAAAAAPVAAAAPGEPPKTAEPPPAPAVASTTAPAPKADAPPAARLAGSPLPPPPPQRAALARGGSARTVVDAPACLPDDRWKRDRLLDLSELGTLAAGDATRYGVFEAEDQPLSRLVKSASTPAECAEATRRVAALQKALLQPAASGCQPTLDWKQGQLDDMQRMSDKVAARLNLEGRDAELPARLAPLLKLRAQVEKATTPAHCAEVVKQFDAWMRANGL